MNQDVEFKLHATITKLTSQLKKKDSKIRLLKKENKIKDEKIIKLKKIISDMTKNNSDVDKTRLLETTKTVQDLSKKNQKQDMIIAEQNKRLDIHENAHVPPSKQGPLHDSGSGTADGSKRKGKGCGAKKTLQGKNKGKNKRGGVLNHKGGTRVHKPTSVKKHTAEECPKGHADIVEVGEPKKRTIVSIPDPVPCIVTRHLTQEYFCSTCKAHFKAEDELPETGQYDYSVLRLIAQCFKNRMTNEIISEDLWSRHRIDISPQAVSDLSERASDMLAPERDRIKRKVMNSPEVLMDETDYEGEPLRYILVARTKKDAVVYMHATNRSGKDLISQMSGFKGKITRDGYTAYDSEFPDNIKQRCTQHLERDAKNVAKRVGTQAAKALYSEISKLFKTLRKWTRGKHSRKVRENRVKKSEAQMRRIISRYRKSNNRQMRKVGTTLENALPETFTFVLYPQVESTTNLAEQSVRKVISHRNSRIQLKSDRGAETLCTILTCVESWKLQKLNVWEQLCKHISHKGQMRARSEASALNNAPRHYSAK